MVRLEAGARVSPVLLHCVWTSCIDLQPPIHWVPGPLTSYLKWSRAWS